MARMFWYGAVGYADEQTRDDTVAAFTAGVQQHTEHLTPATWEMVTIPAGVTTPVEVDGLPGFSFAFDILGGWENTQAWADLSDVAQGPAESGGQGMNNLV